jgi:hypothetical protein
VSEGGIISGRRARRAALRAKRLKGPGYTRAWRKGRTKRKREVEDAQQDDA